MTNDDVKTPCPSCVRPERTAASWRYVGEDCGHVECPNRRPVTAAPPAPQGYRAPSDEPWPYTQTR